MALSYDPKTGIAGGLSGSPITSPFQNKILSSNPLNPIISATGNFGSIAPSGLGTLQGGTLLDPTTTNLLGIKSQPVTSPSVPFPKGVSSPFLNLPSNPTPPAVAGSAVLGPSAPLATNYSGLSNNAQQLLDAQNAREQAALDAAAKNNLKTTTPGEMNTGQTNNNAQIIKQALDYYQSVLNGTNPAFQNLYNARNTLLRNQVANQQDIQSYLDQNGVLQSGVANAVNNIQGGFTTGSRERGFQNLLATGQANLAQQQLQTQGSAAERLLGLAPTVAGTTTDAQGNVTALIRNPATGEVTAQPFGAIGQPQTAYQSQVNPITGALQIFNSATGKYVDATGSGGQSITSIGGTTGNPLLDQYTATTISGQPYINSDRVSDVQKNAVKIQAAQAKIPYLTTEEIGKIRNIEVTQQNMQGLNAVAQKILSSGLLGRLQGLTVNRIENLAQSNPDIASFKVFRDTAINTIQALAGGQGSGFRLNQAEINIAASNMPEITDNLETANKKVALINGFMDKWNAEILGSHAGQTAKQGDTFSVGW